MTLWAGELFGHRSLSLPSDSYANFPEAELGVWLFQVEPQGRAQLPAAVSGKAINRRVYFIEGESILLSSTGSDTNYNRDINDHATTTSGQATTVKQSNEITLDASRLRLSTIQLLLQKC